ncbi:MAG TPA: DUF523 and DUF1722 domain-containing protein [Vicinamibacterales bacterium]|nr:DUF523 and DUF1722 domain-containing protein [Vicinamibacterales bacterium]
MNRAWLAQRPVRVGISSCLLGDAVRFDGGHKRDAFLTDTFGRFVEWVPVCPEVECGLGTPRESMRLVRVGDGIRLLTVRTGVDRTDQLLRYAHERVAQLTAQDLCGFVLKKDSPSCGMARVKIYGGGTVPTKSGRGLFAAALADRCPNLPIEEEGRLSDPCLRDNFVERVFAYGRLRALFDGRWNQGALVHFHTAHKFTLMAHSPAAYQELGRLVAQAASLRRHDLTCQYSRGFMGALSNIATRPRHANALQHMVGYFKERLDRASKTELLGAIDDYVRELVPLVVPIMLIRHHVRVHDVAYLAGQVYLAPHPKELMLRNHV